VSDKTRVLIVDDEPLARRHIRRILSADPEVVVVGESGDGRGAVGAIATLRPDIVLLDIQMPEMNGFDVLSALGAAQMPAVIFVTAFDEFALKAFDVNAIDYVLKPVDKDRLLSAVARARGRRGSESQQEAFALALKLAMEARPGRSADRIVLKVDGRHLFVTVDTIDWLEAVDDYVRFHIGKSTHLVRATLSSYEQQLPQQFLRVHRSAIINTHKLQEIQTTAQGDYRLLMLDGTRLPTGRSYRAALTELVRTFTVITR